MTYWVCMRVQRFDQFEASHPLLKVTIDAGKMVGFLPVFTTRADAESEFPCGPFRVMQEVEHDD